MSDVVDKATRSRMMSGIRGKDTGPELQIRKALHRLGFRYRVHRSKLPGRPDIVLAKHQAVILVHGCFWHRHSGCKFATNPKTRPDFWLAKFRENTLRDQRNVDELLNLGWRVGIVWECAIKDLGAEKVTAAVSRWITDSNAVFLELPDLRKPSSSCTKSQQSINPRTGRTPPSWSP